MLDIKKIDEAIAEVIETALVGFGSVDTYNWQRIFKRVYGKTGYNYHCTGYIGELDMDEKAAESHIFPEDADGRLEVFVKVAKAYGGITRRGFGGMAVFGDRFIFLVNGTLICHTDDILEVRENIQKFLPEREDDIPTIKYVLMSNGSISYTRIPINKTSEDLSGNYNDDIPTERLVSVLRDKQSSISILHGIPGCGKTTYIRKLVADNKDLDFYWLDAKMLNLTTDESFLRFLINNNNAVYIIEDCEALLRDRGEYADSPLASLLNISDGMLGDSLNIKFLCTFNADLEKIDPAVLRKGRLKVKYEFKELASEKVKVLADKLGITIPEIKPMPLCEIYNFEHDNGVKAPEPRRKVGF